MELTGDLKDHGRDSSTELGDGLREGQAGPVVVMHAATVKPLHYPLSAELMEVMSVETSITAQALGEGGDGTHTQTSILEYRISSRYLDCFVPQARNT